VIAGRCLCGSVRDRITEYELSPRVFRAFCSTCGSPVYGRLAAEPDSMRVRSGA
jgi:hypothetical protein